MLWTDANRYSRWALSEYTRSMRVRPSSQTGVVYDGILYKQAHLLVIEAIQNGFILDVWSV